MPEKTVQKESGKKPVPSKKPKPQQEVVVQIPLSELHPFPDHPFQVREDASMQETAESVKEYGVLVPALARPREDGGYELIAGHRRKHACELAGLATMPVIVRDIDRDAATIIMVDSNLQRENILPSERAKAYKMKMEAIKRQGARTDLTSPKISAKFRSDDEVGQDAGVSGDTIRNYIALTQLVPELQQMVDEKKIALSPAYQLAALTPKEQGLLLETIDSEQATPSLSQAQRMKKLSQSGELNEDAMLSIMMEQKKPEKNDITDACDSGAAARHEKGGGRMTYIENIFLCMVSPLLVAALCMGRRQLRFFLFCIAGMGVCLLSAYINTFLAAVCQADALAATAEIAPVVEEMMKLLPLVFYLLVFEPERDKIKAAAITLSLTFATFENVCYLIQNGADRFSFIFFRGFGTGAMHVLCGLIVGGGLAYTWQRTWLKIAGTCGLLGAAITLHAIYNLLIAYGGAAQYVAYALPVLLVAAGKLSAFRLSQRE